MLELKTLREDPETVRQALRRRGWNSTRLLDDALALDQALRARMTAHQELLARNRKTAKDVGRLMRSKQFAKAEEAKATHAGLKQQIRLAAHDEDSAREALIDILMMLPNVPHPSVPQGQFASHNQVVRQVGELPAFGFKPKPHWVLAERLHLVDFARGAKTAGAGFPFYVGAGARLQRALIGLFLAEAIRAGYLEIQPPLLVNEVSARGTGQLPDKEGQMYHLRDDDLYLVPTAEVPLTNFYRGEIIPEDSLPLKICGHTPCWRREAGSYGKTVRGLNRLHQFDKVEIVQVVHPDKSYAALETMTTYAEGLLQMLKLPYRTLLMCSGEMGFNQTIQYDLEVWSAGQDRWLEVSSLSNFGTFQAERLKLRYRPQSGGKPQLVHTLNGSALALPRIVAALLELRQQADGSVSLPACLSRHAGMGESWTLRP